MFKKIFGVFALAAVALSLAVLGAPRALADEAATPKARATLSITLPGAAAAPDAVRVFNAFRTRRAVAYRLAPSRFSDVDGGWEPTAFEPVVVVEALVRDPRPSRVSEDNGDDIRRIYVRPEDLTAEQTAALAARRADFAAAFPVHVMTAGDRFEAKDA